MSGQRNSTASSDNHSVTEVSPEEEAALSSCLGFDVKDFLALERAIFTCINDDNRNLLLDIFEKFPSDTTILQILLTTTYPNRDGFYRHDPDVLVESQELLGPRLNITILPIA
jgi:hypothetical protein